MKKYGKIDRFVHISTDEVRFYEASYLVEFQVYGDSGLENDEKPKTENQPLKPGNPYAATKVCVSKDGDLISILDRRRVLLSLV